MPHSFLKPLTYCGFPYHGSCDPDTLNGFTDACVKKRSGSAGDGTAGLFSRMRYTSSIMSQPHQVRS